MEFSLKTCSIKQAIDSEDYILASPLNITIEEFNIDDNSKIKYLPRGIGIKLPNLKEFWAENCNLSVVRHYYFQNMRKLQNLNMYGNKIVLIESSAFKDLVSVETLNLAFNMIETFDEKLLTSLVNLQKIYLYNNKIKFLSPVAFKIPKNGKLQYVNLEENTCINSPYDLVDLGLLETDIRANCSG